MGGDEPRRKEDEIPEGYEVSGYPLGWYLNRQWEEVRGRKPHLDPDDKHPSGDPYVTEYRKERAARQKGWAGGTLKADPDETAKVRALIKNLPPNEAMIPSRLLGDDYQMYDNTPQAAPYDPMAASKRALMMEALRRIGALPEGTTPSF